MTFTEGFPHTGVACGFGTAVSKKRSPAAHCPLSQSPTPLPRCWSGGNGGGGGGAGTSAGRGHGPAALRRRGAGLGAGPEPRSCTLLLLKVPGSASDPETPRHKGGQEIRLLVFGSFASPCTHNLSPGLLSLLHSAGLGRPLTASIRQLLVPCRAFFLSWAPIPAPLVTEVSLLQTWWGYVGEVTINLPCRVGLRIPKRLLHFTDVWLWVVIYTF